MAEAVILTVDNGGTKTRVARGGEDIERVEAYNTPREYAQAIDHIASMGRVVLDGKRPDGVGFSVAGKIEDGRIVSAGQLQKYGWVGHPFAADVAEALGISPERVVLLNDCAAGANAERTARLPKDGEAGAFMTLSTGFGSALYTPEGLITDEAGHWPLKPGAICSCGQDGHMEAHVAGSGIVQKYGTPGEDILHTDPRWDEIKYDFHESMALTLRRYNHDYGLTLKTIGFTGSVALGGPDMLGGLQCNLDYRMGATAPHIDLAIYGDESGLYGAAFAADAALRAA